MVIMTMMDKMMAKKKTINKRQTQGGVGNVAVASRCKDL